MVDDGVAVSQRVCFRWDNVSDEAKDGSVT